MSAKYHIKTEDGWYLYELRGAVFMTFVCEVDKARAAIFDQQLLEANWLGVIERHTKKKCTLEAIT